MPVQATSRLHGDGLQEATAAGTGVPDRGGLGRHGVVGASVMPTGGAMRGGRSVAGGHGLDAEVNPGNRGGGTEGHPGETGAGDEPTAPGPLVFVEGTPPSNTYTLVDATCARLDANPA